MILREIWRTACLVGFASRIYRGNDGNIYHSDGGAHPRHIYKIPDVPTLDVLMRETCWATTQTALVLMVGLGLFALVQLAALHWARVLPLMAPLALLLWIGHRNQKNAYARCARLAAKESELVLTRAPDLARLKAEKFVRLCAALILCIAFANYISIGTAEGLVVAKPLEAPLRTFCLLIAMFAYRVALAGFFSSKSDRLDLAFDNRKPSL